ncbi:hypothetical protein AO727_15695 [Acinetobacter baumannii]|uniref:hypothetical protein n=1 Tax=Acinetobacter baumannii TaxID=470 RepID=UPI0007185DA0|nr:hypothetical protein [Acinetobacter baumannii]EHU1557198.1 hypothetical protein [Acinetobacter baumannii]KRW17294.1 hypothetical protein AO727_15695 [Acinetobacter baumannii]MCT9183617.1 hypothetical protein [Acinetobacter baumannii]MCT9224255.1 hypothetical protein [Acinetobacter baumannii]MCT9276164.1 hypothetical protein [Acinetobacter baumannii]
MVDRRAENFEGFAYLDYDNPMVAWNIVRGVFDSPDILDESNPEQFISIALMSMLQKPISSRLKSEWELERVRSEYYPTRVSRLRGFFVFDEVESIARFWETENWGEHFQDQYLSDIGVSAKRSSRLDSNWIKCIWNENGDLLPNWERNAHSYWQGLPFPQKEAIWERIVEGSITVWSMFVKHKALETVMYKWPNSLNILNYACKCAAYGDLDGQTFALIKREENRIKCSFYLRMKNIQDSIFLDRLKYYIEKNPKCSCNLYNEGETYLPDLSIYNIEF